MLLDDKVYTNFHRNIKNAKKEAEVRKAWIQLIESTIDVKGIIHEEEDYRDASFQNVLIEFKNKGFFHHSKESIKFEEATNGRILKYVNRWAKEIDKDTSYFFGIVTDGDDFSICSVRNNKVESGKLLPTTKDNMEYVLSAINSNLKMSLSSKSLIENFGKNSILGDSIISDLYQTFISDLTVSSTNKTKLFYKEWVTLYGQVSDMANYKKKSVLVSLGFPEDAELSHVLFIINTYNSLLVKLLAAELVSTLTIASYPNFSEELFSVSNKEFLTRLNAEIERNGYFDSSNISNFISEVLFSWYVYSDNRSNNLINDLKQLVKRIALFNVDEHTAMNSGDILKEFYQNLVPESLRKSLGEFYTPDWLVNYMVNKVSPIENKRILDPTCGSGSFLLSVIKKKEKYFKSQKISASEQLDRIINQVVGYDLNPLAVQTARVNYLFLISDLLQECPGKEIEIPVLLADSIYTPTINKENDEYEYTIGSNTADLKIRIPKKLVDNRSNLLSTFNILNECIEEGNSYIDAQSKVIGILGKQDDKFYLALEDCFNKVKELHKKAWDGIWFQIISDFFWSIEMEQFDIVLGNPPWVRWSALPELYRQRVKKTANKYNIFSEHKYYGGNELDISALVTYTVADKWLKTNGIMSFLLPQNHLQNDSSSGFRLLTIDNYNLQPKLVEDLKQIKVFDDATNKPMIFTFVKKRRSNEDKNNGIKYPVPYIIWNSVNGKRVVKSSELLSRVLNGLSKTKFQAEPLHFNPRSPWIVGNNEDLQVWNKIIGTATYEGRKGVTTDLNGIFSQKLYKIMIMV